MPPATVTAVGIAPPRTIGGIRSFFTLGGIEGTTGRPPAMESGCKPANEIAGAGAFGRDTTGGPPEVFVIINLWTCCAVIGIMGGWPVDVVGITVPFGLRGP